MIGNEKNKYHKEIRQNKPVLSLAKVLVI